MKANGGNSIRKIMLAALVGSVMLCAVFSVMYLTVVQAWLPWAISFGGGGHDAGCCPALQTSAGDSPYGKTVKEINLETVCL